MNLAIFQVYNNSFDKENTQKVHEIDWHYFSDKVTLPYLPTTSYQSAIVICQCESLKKKKLVCVSRILHTTLGGIFVSAISQWVNILFERVHLKYYATAFSNWRPSGKQGCCLCRGTLLNRHPCLLLKYHSPTVTHNKNFVYDFCVW